MKTKNKQGRFRDIFHFHSQNLGRKDQSMLLHGRCWWRILESRFRFEWRFFGDSSTKIGFDFAGDDDEDLGFHIAIWKLFSLYFIIERLPILRKMFKEIAQGYGYETSLGFYDGAAWVHVAYNELWGAKCVKSKWLPRDVSVWKADRSGFGFYVSIHYVDMLLDRQVYRSEKIGDAVELQVQIHPDTTLLGIQYKISVQMTRDSWTRARWPFPKVVTRARVDCIPPIPIPGKGESDWDMGDDALHSMTCPAVSPIDALKNVIESVERTRKKYGLPNSISAKLAA